VKQRRPEVRAGLDRYTALLYRRAVPLGLVSQRDRARLRERHVSDSLRALACLGKASTVADVGSGAGLPGIPVAIARPDVEVVLIEPRRKRAAFLELCTEELALRNVEVIPRRSSAANVVVDVCLTRALGEAATSWALAEPVLGPSGWLVYFAGRSWRDDDRRALEARGLRVEICAPASFSWQGPLVKIGREDPDVSAR